MLQILNKELFNIKENLDAIDHRNNEVISDAKDTEFYPSDAFTEDSEKPNNALHFPIAKIRIYEPSENEPKLRATVRPDSRGFNRVNMNISSRNTNDDLVVLAAIPYRGILCPVDCGEYLNLYKAQIIRSSTFSVEFDGMKYNHVLYMVIGLNTQAIADAIKANSLPTDENFNHIVTFTMVTNSPIRKKGTKENIPGKAICTTTTISINVETGAVAFNANSDEVSDFVIPSMDDPRPQLFKLYVAPQDTRSFDKKPKKFDSKPVSTRGESIEYTSSFHGEDSGKRRNDRHNNNNKRRGFNEDDE